MNLFAVSLSLVVLIQFYGCSKSSDAPASQPLVAPSQAPAKKPVVPPTAEAPAPTLPAEAPELPPQAVTASPPDIATEMANNPCPFGLDESHEAQELADIGVKLIFSCVSLANEANYADWKRARDSYPQAAALLAKNRALLTKAKRPPQLIAVDFIGEPSGRFVSEENLQAWRMKISLTKTPESLEKNLDFFLAVDQTFGAYELKNFPKLTVEVEGYPNDSLLDKASVDRKFRVVKDLLDANRAELKTLSERGLKSLRLDSDYKLELLPHRLTLKRGDSLAGNKKFISEYPLRNFYSQKPEFHVALDAGAGLSSKRDYSAVAAMSFAKAIQDFISIAQSLKTKKVTDIQFYLLPGEAPSKKNNQILFYHGELKVHMIRADGIYPAETSLVLKQIKSLD